jgi:transcriptional regulator with XRE-family HTH domain
MTRLTNPEIAERIGMTATGVSRLRSGNRRPSVLVAERILSEFAPDRYQEGVVAFSDSGEAQVRFLESIFGAETE